MWLCALLAVAALHEAQALYSFRQRSSKPSSLANIELLIPLSIPSDQLTSDELTASSREDRAAQREDSDEHETYSSIPAYAFTFDQELNSHHAGKLPEASRSLYLTNIWSRNNMHEEEESDEEEGLPSVATAGRVACQELARRQQGRARELMLYLCEELLGVLRARCSCDQRAAPWFGPPGGRREASRPHKNIVNV